MPYECFVHECYGDCKNKKLMNVFDSLEDDELRKIDDGYF